MTPAATNPRTPKDATMDRTTCNLYLCALLLTLAETKTAPSSIVLLALQADPGAQGRVLTGSGYAQLLELAVAGGLLTQSNHELAITPKGVGMAAKIAAHNAKAGV